MAQGRTTLVRKQAQVRAKAADGAQARIAAALALSVLFLLGLTTLVWAEDEVKIIKAHGFNELAELKYGPDFEHFDYVNVDAPRGGTLSYAAQGTFDSFNPFTRQGRAGARSADQYETLMVPSYDEVGSYYGLIAESLEYPETQDWVIFNLRPEATFSDGTPVTAEDVVFSHNLFLDQGLESYARAVRNLIPEAEVLDTHRVKFYFNPDVPRRGLITQVGGTPVLSKAWFEADPENRRLDKARLEPGIGTAPYILDSYDINRRIEYVRRDDYWGYDLPVNRGRYNFDRIRIEYFTDSVAAMEAFKAGEFTFRQENNSKNWATSYDFPAVDRGWVIKDELPDGNVPNATGFVMNLNRPQFADPRVREAVQLAYNFEWTNESLQYGAFQQRNSFWEGSDLEAEGVPEGRELEILQSLGDAVDPEILTVEPVMAHTSNPERQNDRRNLRAASRLLDEAGWEVGDDGLRRNADGTVLAIEFLSDDPVLDRLINPFVDNLKAIGIDASYNRIDNAQFTLRRRDRDFDMIRGGYRKSLQPSTGLYQQYGKEDAEYSVFNPSGVNGDDIEPLIDNIVASTDIDELSANARALDRVLRHKRIMVPTWYLGNHWAAYWDMYEHPANLPPYTLGVEDLWWINAEKEAALKAEGALR